MDYLVISLIIFGHISGSESDYCKKYEKPDGNEGGRTMVNGASTTPPVIQICKDGTVSGTSVYIDNRETPMKAVNCTCDIDFGGGTIRAISYNGPGYSSCGIQFILGENIASFSCYANTLSNPSPFSVIYFSKMIVATGYIFLSITDSENITLTCHEPSVTTSMAHVSKTTSITDTKSTTTTTTTTTSTITNTSTTESTDRTVLNQCSEGVSIAVVAGITVGEAVLILLVQAVLWFLCCKRKDACSCLRKSLNRDEMKDNEAYGIVDISNISQGSKVILDTDYVNTDLNSRQNPDT